MSTTASNPGPEAPPGPAKPPTPRDQLASLARAGDFQGILQWVARAPWGTVDLKTMAEFLQAAVNEASRKDAATFSEEVFQAMVTFSSYLMLRLQLCCQVILDRADRSPHGALERLPDDLFSTLIPQLHQTQGVVAELHHSWASTARKWELSRRRQAQEPGKPSKSQPRSRANGRCNGFAVEHN